MCERQPRFQGIRALPHLLLALWACGAGPAWSQSLLERSPFLPPDFNQPSTSKNAPTEQPTSVQHLRFKGVFSLGGIVKVNLFNTQTHKGTWVPIDGTIEGYRVVAYDSEKRAVELEIDGEIARFELAQPTDTPIPVATASATTTARRPTVRPSVRTNPTGSSTVRRRTIVPPRPASRSARSRSNTNPRNNRRTVVRPNRSPSPQSSVLPNRNNNARSANKNNNNSFTPRQPRQLPQ